MKNTQLLILGAGLLLFIAGVSYMSYGSEKPNETMYSASAIAALENDFDFGAISMRDGKVSHLFEVKNSGAETVVITSAYTSCMCTEAYIIDATGKKDGPFGMPGHTSPRADVLISAGETARVEAVFDPAAHGPSGVGLAERSIYLETNSQEKPRVELKFRAVVTR